MIDITGYLEVSPLDRKYRACEYIGSEEGFMRVMQFMLCCGKEPSCRESELEKDKWILHFENDPDSEITISRGDWILVDESNPEVKYLVVPREFLFRYFRYEIGQQCHLVSHL